MIDHISLSHSLLSVLQHNTSYFGEMGRYFLSTWLRNSSASVKLDCVSFHSLEGLSQLSTVLSLLLSYEITDIGILPYILQITVPNIPLCIFIHVVLSVFSLPRNRNPAL